MIIKSNTEKLSVLADYQRKISTEELKGTESVYKILLSVSLLNDNNFKTIIKHCMKIFFLYLLIFIGFYGCGSANKISEKPASIVKYDFPQRARRIEPLQSEPQPQWIEENSSPAIDKKFVILPARSAHLKTEPQVKINLRKTAEDNTTAFLVSLFNKRLKETAVSEYGGNSDYQILDRAIAHFKNMVADTKYWEPSGITDKIYIEKWQTYLGEIFFAGYTLIKYPRAYFDKIFAEAVDIAITDISQKINMESDRKTASALKKTVKKLRKISIDSP